MHGVGWLRTCYEATRKRPDGIEWSVSLDRSDIVGYQIDDEAMIFLSHPPGFIPMSFHEFQSNETSMH